MTLKKDLFSRHSFVLGGMAAALLVSGCEPEGGAPSLENTPPDRPAPVEQIQAPGEAKQEVVNGTPLQRIDSTVGLADGTGFVFCSGILVSPYVVMTAAHCLDTPVASVLFGPGQNNGIYVPAQAQVKHPGYNPSAFGVNDVGVVALAQRAPDRAHFAVLSSTPPPSNSSGTIVGYGWTGVNQTGVAGQKHSLNVPIYTVDATQIQTTNSCNGDSGGPMYHPMNSIWAHGVASWGQTGCGGYSYYMRADNYRAWVLGFVQQYNGLNPARKFGDFNADGRDDFIWRNQDGYVTTWGALADATVDNVWQIVGVGDINGDGADDFVWRHLDGTVFAAGQQWVVDNSYQIVAIGDMNGNGADDFVWRHQSGAVVVWGVGDWTVDNSWQLAGVADLNGDNKDDFIWRHASGYVTTWGYGDYSMDNSWQIAGFGDVDGNGTDDFVWRHLNGHTVVWGVADYGVVGLDWHLVGLADLDGNGADNLVWRNDNGHTVAWGVTDYGIVPLNWEVMPVAR